MLELPNHQWLLHSLAKEAAAQRAVIIDFSAQWCGPCKRVKPLLEELELKYPDQLRVFSVDCDVNRESADEYDVKALPTLVYFYSDGTEAARTEGFDNRRITQVIEQLLE